MRDQLAAEGNRIMAGRPDLEALTGKGAQQMAGDNNRNFARFMEAMILDYQPKIMVETVLWVFRTYRAHGFQTAYWAANLNVWVDMIRRELPRDVFEAIHPFYNWLIISIPLFTQLTEVMDEDGSEPAPSRG